MKKIEVMVKKELESFIPEEKIYQHLEEGKKADKKKVLDILEKAKELKGLSPEETAVLLQNLDPELDEALFETARWIKMQIYGNRLVLFAPLYITNECGNICAYCGFRADNKLLKRKTLTFDEIREEVEILEDMGHKRLLLVYGEHPKHDAEWIAKTIEVVYSTKKGRGEIRRVNVNSAPLDVEGFRILKSIGIGTYQCFQETYHRATYDKVHLGGRKKDFLWRLYALDRAQQAGIDDVAMGVLFGLYDWKFEVLGLLYHAIHLEKEFGVGPHTISFPRIEPALGADLSYNPPYPLSDHDFKRLVAILRIAVPYTGLILTTRETPQLRREVFQLGTSQISAGSRTYPGGYRDMRSNMPDKQQFTIGDPRPLDEVIYDIVSNLGYLPSFCTACYRLGRTGEHFMELAKPGFIKNFCQPNALLTFVEYLLDYASEKTKQVGWKLVEKEIQAIEDPRRRKAVVDRIERLKKGERDLYF